MRKAIIWFLFGDSLAILLLVISLKFHPQKPDEIRDIIGRSDGIIRR